MKLRITVELDVNAVLGDDELVSTSAPIAHNVENAVDDYLDAGMFQDGLRDWLADRGFDVESLSAGCSVRALQASEPVP